MSKPSANLKQLAQLLTSLRNRRRLSKAQAAEAVWGPDAKGARARLLSKWESAETAPSAPLLGEYAIGMSATRDELVRALRLLGVPDEVFSPSRRDPAMREMAEQLTGLLRTTGVLPQLERQGVLRGTARSSSPPSDTLQREHLSTRDEVYSVGIQLVGEAEDKIRAIVLGSGAKAPRTWALAVYRRLRQKRHSRPPLIFESIVAFDFDDPPPEMNRQVNGRFRLQERYGVRDQVHLSFLNQKPLVGIDVLIIDDKHVIVAATAGRRKLQEADLFYDQPEVTRWWIQWFDRMLLPRTIPYTEWAGFHAE